MKWATHACVLFAFFAGTAMARLPREERSEDPPRNEWWKREEVCARLPIALGDPAFLELAKRLAELKQRPSVLCKISRVKPEGVTNGPAPASPPDTPWLRGFRCEGSRQECFDKATQRITAYLKQEADWGRAKGIDVARNFWKIQGSEFLNIQPTRDIIIFINGLEGTPQSGWSLTGELAKYDVPVIAVNLPGHGMDSANHRKVTYEDWLKEAQGALELARAIGTRVTIIGQSTGGAIAARLAQENPDLVKKLVLVEPALRVHGHLNLGACAGSPLFDRVGSSGLGSVSLPMGCEVPKIIGRAAEKMRIEEPDTFNQGEAGGSNYFEERERRKRLAYYKSIPAKTIIFQTPGDHVVSNHEMNEIYKRAKPDTQIVETHRSLSHGQVFGRKNFRDYMQDRLGKYLDGDGIGDLRWISGDPDLGIGVMAGECEAFDPRHQAIDTIHFGLNVLSSAMGHWRLAHRGKIPLGVKLRAATQSQWIAPRLAELCCDPGYRARSREICEGAEEIAQVFADKDLLAMLQCRAFVDEKNPMPSLAAASKYYPTSCAMDPRRALERLDFLLEAGPGLLARQYRLLDTQREREKKERPPSVPKKGRAADCPEPAD